jgi:transposase-like protein
MARRTKADAARQLGISRTTLYKLIDQGSVSATPDGLIDDTELVHAAPYVDILKERSRTSMDNTDMDMHPRYDEHRERPLEPVHEHPWTGVHERQWTSTDPLVDV